MTDKTNDLDDLDLGDESLDDLDSGDNSEPDNTLDKIPEAKKVKKKTSSVVKPKQKFSSGNLIFGIVVFAVVAAGLGYFAVEEFLPAHHLENLVSESESSRKESQQYFANGKQKKWFERRVTSLLSHPSATSQSFGCRALTAFALQSSEGERKEAVSTFEKLLTTKSLSDRVHAEVIFDLGQLGQADPTSGALEALAAAVQTVREDGVGLIRKNRHYALQTLNQIEDERVDRLMLSLIKELTDSIGKDLSITLYGLLAERFLKETKEGAADASGPNWERHLEIHAALLNGYRTHEDQRVRKICWQTFEKLSHLRGLKLWVQTLQSEELVDRIVAVTLLRRFSDRVFDFDPYQEGASTEAWDNWVSSANP